MSVMTNVVLMCLTAGQELRTVISDPFITRKYNIAIAMILESSAIYCAAVIGVVISGSFNSPSSPVYSIFRGAVAQLVPRLRDRRPVCIRDTT
ncbi:hypothetical protein C8R44DRAFT_865108 [Mycena epipterygia]|nr:hypothetical protein C8R44DRAFT_865108 [Mycena epipterygia]